MAPALDLYLGVIPTAVFASTLVGAAVGGLGSHAATREWTISVRVIESFPGVFRAEVRTLIGGAAGERDVDRAGCSEALDAAVLIVALALSDTEAAEPDPLDVADREAQADDTGEAPGEPGQASTTEPSSTDPSRLPPRRGEQVVTPRRGGGTWLAARVGPSWGPLPELGTAVETRVDFAEDVWRLGIGLRGLPHGAVYVVDQGSAIELGVLTLSPRGCLEARLEDMALGGCIGAEAGVLIAAGSGLDEARTIALPWLSVGILGTAAWVPDQRVRLEAAVHASAVSTRPRLAIGPDVVHQPEPVEVGGTLGLAIRLDEAR